MPRVPGQEVLLRGSDLVRPTKDNEMASTLCDLCDEPACYHETVLQATGAREHHFCAAHGRRRWLTALPLDTRLPRADWRKLVHLAKRRRPHRPHN